MRRHGRPGPRASRSAWATATSAPDCSRCSACATRSALDAIASLPAGGRIKFDTTALGGWDTGLIVALGLDPRLAGATADWLDSDQQELIPDGAEDPLYSGFTPAYRTANRPIANITELAAIDGMDPASFEILLPHVAALPGRTAVNVNTASIPVLQSLGPNITIGDAEGLVSARQEGGFVDYSDIFAPLVEPDLVPWIAESSSYFQLKAVVQIDTVRVSLFTVLHRNASNGAVTPILRSLGTI